MSDHDHSSTDDHREGYNFAHPMPVPMLLTVFCILVFLTIVTVAQASFDFGSIDVAIVMGIATIKAIIVALFFMHLLYDKPFNLAIFLSAFVFVGLFVSLTLSDSWLTSKDFIPVDDAVITSTVE
ncbi:cytochrome C oxidase subunit IV family protein [Novipirellula aureliae]|nr:cytochrome C oxidase subunit IV family protein [Novipirellula aureliae]